MKRFDAAIAKVDDTLGIAFGFAIVCATSGKPYYDLQGDHVPEDAMAKAATDFMTTARVAKLMHEGDPIGSVVFAWPMTQSIADALGIRTQKTGLLVGIKPDDPQVLEQFRTGQLTGFSIGGSRIEDEEVSA